ncbi:MULTISPECIES: hypothetical protein [Paracoccus]|uniref:hypothetical protein n=1 Tax=Paracoccus TaxID=265 RepID=UPI000FD9D900|nr:MULTISPECIES: hypothetical protein [Paracoccus]AZY95437.1 hypothetical protein EOJ32_16730 [Paracoccus sp. Arc7-R13]TNC05896.1 hypothetical protein FHD68_02865 [Paracoccus marcusii]
MIAPFGKLTADRAMRPLHSEQRHAAAGSPESDQVKKDELSPSRRCLADGQHVGAKKAPWRCNARPIRRDLICMKAG